MKEISTEAWLAELERLSSELGEGHTVAELAEIAGCCEQTMRGRLRALQAQGRLVVVKGRRRAIDGRMSAVSLYSLASQE